MKRWGNGSGCAQRWSEKINKIKLRAKRHKVIEELCAVLRVTGNQINLHSLVHLVTKVRNLSSAGESSGVSK